MVVILDDFWEKKWPNSEVLEKGIYIAKNSTETLNILYETDSEIWGE